MPGSVRVRLRERQRRGRQRHVAGRRQRCEQHRGVGPGPVLLRRGLQLRQAVRSRRGRVRGPGVRRLPLRGGLRRRVLHRDERGRNRRHDQGRRQLPAGRRHHGVLPPAAVRVHALHGRARARRPRGAAGGVLLHHLLLGREPGQHRQDGELRRRRPESERVRGVPLEHPDGRARVWHQHQVLRRRQRHAWLLDEADAGRGRERSVARRHRAEELHHQQRVYGAWLHGRPRLRLRPLRRRQRRRDVGFLPRVARKERQVRFSLPGRRAVIKLRTDQLGHPVLSVTCCKP
ncbi:MAG: hypothetical protein UT32_C0005G0043 [Parcubacteria group bacterium GW2011_GWC2_39_14]|nr:MAG: hypothetical protein UT32_C0005G0043 [Parcubacteria group bacterium GW2011_GWC2_39_14]KKR54624.1 MAG: hypothetical protein UT91_C0012G0043 [Parcubacteria group bacterium GW2011_GWA2_40_23]